MNSKERHEARYQRRKQARADKALAKTGDARDFDKVFSFRHLYRSSGMCLRGVRFKASVQAFNARRGMKTERRYTELQGGRLNLGKSYAFDRRERGRLRHLNSIGINDRVPQKCNSKYALKPVLHRSLIHDNYASQEGKGTSEARLRFKLALVRHIRKHGMNGGIILMDIHHFFDSIKHSEVRKLLFRYFDDKRIIGLNMRIVKHCKEKAGLVLGSENSQDFAATIFNGLDHYAKQELGVEFYGRYNDDIVIIDPDFGRMKEIYAEMKACIEKLGFTLNEKKSRIIRFGRSFSILKRKYSFTHTGKIIVRPDRASVIRERRLIKKLHKKFLAGEISLGNCYKSVNSWVSSISRMNPKKKRKKKRETEMDRISIGTRHWKIERSIWKLFDDLFLWPWVSGQEERMRPCITS